MVRKDCEPDRQRGMENQSPARLTMVVLAMFWSIGVSTECARAGTIRLWPTAVVIQETIRLNELCAFRGFSTEEERLVSDLTVGEAPKPGGSRVIHIDLIRTLLAESEINMATVTFHGPMRCSVSRPSTASKVDSDSTPIPRKMTRKKGVFVRRKASSRQPKRVSDAKPSPQPATLRAAVTDFFNAELSRYGGKAEITFDRISEPILDLSGPTYTFRVRRAQGPALGMVSVEVEVIANAKTVQTVPMVAHVTMTRPAVVARHSINQGATIQRSDVEIISLTFARTDKLGVNDSARVIGQRARRFIAEGSLVRSSDIESVPLVVRGQLVTVASVVGAVRVVTTAKAAGDGLLGEIIRVRAMGKIRTEFDARVVGPGKVQVGPDPTAEQRIELAQVSSS